MDIGEEGIKPDDKTYVTIFNTSSPSSDHRPNLKIQLNHPFKTWGVLGDAKHPGLSLAFLAFLFSSLMAMRTHAEW